MLRPARRWAPLLVLVVACNAAKGSFCAGGVSPPIRVEQSEPASADAAAAALPIIGERVVVRDGASGASWRAVEAGTAGLHASHSEDFDPAAKAPFRYLFGLDAEREDTKERRHIEVAVTFVPGADGPQPVAIELESVDPDDARGGPTQTRTFWACPHGGKLHYARWAKGQSPCHREPLVPIVLCGCDDSVDHVDANDCKDSRTALKKTACARDDGLPIPPP